MTTPLPLDDFASHLTAPRSLDEFATRYGLSPAAVTALFESAPALAAEIDATGKLSRVAPTIAARVAPHGTARRIAVIEIVAIGEELARLGRLVAELIENGPVADLAPFCDRMLLGVELMAFSAVEFAWLGAGAPAGEMLDPVFAQHGHDAA